MEFMCTPSTIKNKDYRSGQKFQLLNLSYNHGPEKTRNPHSSGVNTLQILALENFYGMRGCKMIDIEAYIAASSSSYYYYLNFFFRTRNDSF